MGDDLMQPDQYNLDGYWEYFPLVHFHDKMLAATNNLWFAPSEQIDVAEMVNQFGDEARQLVKDMDKSGVDWCWKDPRLPIFLTFWYKKGSST